MAFLAELHEAFIRRASQDTAAFEYLVTEHLRMSAVYWGLTAMALLGATEEQLKSDPALKINGMALGDWVMACQHQDGG